ncbi:hypothetical protein UMM65_16025 [Aureibaculum sp. 2210JD6-5]|uniref:hypothetical protein n=1 Tax=Aureibaculum sp. 2210JD6-5 TaxID=3103957 RepID=UPI002AAC9106|nr:hypothetical protein [Aureibaculum sp. 2210JD6-5]MDY7396757.1 hypothetical protein [Aureibaculum sp. 2210JD6-5]
MKRIYVLTFVILLFNSVAYAQSECEVKLQSINTTYKGACKKKLAHGKGEAKGEKDTYIGDFKKGYPHGEGTYTWGNGNIYKGSFAKGKMDGKGVLTLVKANGETEIQEGYFKKGKYLGKYKTPYVVTNNQGVRKVDFQEVLKKTTNEIKITIYANGRIINPPLTITDANNSFIENRNDAVVLKNVNFPIKNIDVSFTFESFSYRAIFDIYKEGSWQIAISL